MVRLLGAVVVAPVIVAAPLRGRPRWPRKRALVPACLNQAVEPSKIPVPRARVAAAGMATQEVLDHVDAMRERNLLGHPPLRCVIERERRTKAMPAVQITDPTAVSVEIDVINRGHTLPAPIGPNFSRYTLSIL